MRKTKEGIIGILSLCGLMALMNLTALAAEDFSGPGLGSGNYIVTVDVDQVNINKEHYNSEVLMQASKGSTYKVLEDMGDGWIKISVDGQEGYIPLDGNTSVSEAEERAAEEAADDGRVLQAAAESSTEKRDKVVSYALQFLGGPYRYGGNNPVTGTDCSGFTSYVMRNGIGVELSRTSGGQSRQGTPVSAEQMRPGDLIFYGSSSRINHAAMYIGNGQVVHASTYATGIKISEWNYRNPVRIMNVIGD